jgi:PhnB protein
MAETEAQAESVFSKLSAGGTVTMPLGKTFWAERFGMCVDKFGVQWMINYAPDSK